MTMNPPDQTPLSKCCSAAVTEKTVFHQGDYAYRCVKCDEPCSLLSGDTPDCGQPCDVAAATPQWRELAADEVVQEGDEYDTGIGVWTRSTLIGFLAGDTGEPKTYRRRVEAAKEQATNSPAVVMGVSPRAAEQGSGLVHGGADLHPEPKTEELAKWLEAWADDNDKTGLHGNAAKHRATAARLRELEVENNELWSLKNGHMKNAEHLLARATQAEAALAAVTRERDAARAKIGKWADEALAERVLAGKLRAYFKRVQLYLVQTPNENIMTLCNQALALTAQSGDGSPLPTKGGAREANRVVKQADTIAQLTAENAEMREDKARLDWLENDATHDEMANAIGDVQCGVLLRAAIDAARAKEGTK